MIAASPALALDETAEAAGGAQAAVSDDDLLYTLGYALAQQLTTLGFTAEETVQIAAGLTDGILDREARVSLEQLGPQVQPYLVERQQRQVEVTKQAGAEFRAQMAAAEGATVTDSGLIYFEELAGTGDAPQAEDTVLVHYHGTFADGRMFDSSLDGDPATFVVGDVVPCFSEGVLRMRTGGKSKMICAPELAYGDRGYPPVIGPGETLVFEVELIEIVTPEATPEELESEMAPEDGAGED